MPIYVYQCARCEVRTELFFRRLPTERPAGVACEVCGATEMERVYTPFAIYRSEVHKLEQLDPKYYQMVDRAIANTPEAEPMRHLHKMTPFDQTPDPGPPITF